MKTQAFLIIALLVSSISMAQVSGKLVSKQTHVKFFSSTPAEDIEANNYASVSTFNTETGEGVFSVPMQSFEFEKSLMQKHFNSSKFLDTKAFPDAKLKGKVSNVGDVDFTKDGSYQVVIEGDLSIKGKTKPISEKATLTVNGSTLAVDSQFNVTLADFGVTFLKGKPSTNISKTVEVTVRAEF